jgi:radical SAM protein with 4Fe4S-binding SPASM domain
MSVVRVRRGHSPNCSASGSVVGLALTTLVGAAVVLNAFADRFTAWTRTRRGGPGPAPSPEPATAPDPASEVRLRDERDGAILAWPDPPALLWLDAAGAAAARDAGARVVGTGGFPPGGLSAPTEVHVAVTDRCPVACEGCYLDAGPERPVHEPGLERLGADLDRLAAMGVFELALGGGEVLLRDDLLDVIARARAVGLVPNLTTSGFGVTPERARRLAGLVGQVNVSLDGLDETYVAVRGWNGTAVALRAIRTLVEAGIRVGVNTVLTRASFAALDALADTLVALGVSEWQWVRFKPSGRGAATYERLALTPEQGLALWPRLLELEARSGLVMRVDCALVPFVAAHGPPPEALDRLAVDGCPGGVGLWARHADGRWSPCSFDAVDGVPSDDLVATWHEDPTLRAWRARAEAPPEPCAGCAYRAVCRGGCRVVARHVVGDALAPDPECPRVRGERP